jgi:spermidine synthase
VPELSNGDPRPLDLRFSPPAGLLGFVATTWQIYLIREFAAQFHGSELTFSFVLAAWLLWGGLGGLWVGRRFLRRAGTARLFAAALLAAPAVFIALRCSRWILKTLPGEVTASSAVLGFALAAALGLNFPLGAAFVRIAEASARNVARVYFWESAGAAAGGLISYLIFIPLLPDWTALAVIQTAAAGASLALFKKGRPAIAVLAAAALGPVLMALDLPLQHSVWRPFDLVVTRDSPYGRIQITRAAEQITVYDNGTRAFSSPDPTAAEDAVHIPMLLQGRPERVLLIGGGLGGALGEILKYPVRRVDYIEIDGRMVEAVRPFLGDADRTALDDARVHLVLTDGRAYLERSPDRFDVIIVSIPEPTTAQFNRYYTVEFFRLAKSRLAPRGVFSFKTGAADNFMSPARRAYLGILRTTLRSVFEAVAVMPGENAVFSGSGSPLRLDAEDLSARLETRGIRTMTLTAEVLRNRLHPLRLDEFRRALEEPGSPINSDGKPIGYFFQTLLWSEQKNGAEARLLRLVSRIPPLPLLAFPGLLFLAALLRAAARRTSESASSVALAWLGLSTMAVEILVLVRYQALYGSFYGHAARLLSMMMAGLAGGAWIGARIRRPSQRRWTALQAGIFGLLLLACLGVSKRPPEIAFDLFLLAWGLLAGDVFVTAGRLVPPPPGRTGRGYAWDLFGSFAGAVVLSAVYVPLAGLPATLAALAAMAALMPAFSHLERKTPRG